MKSENATKEDIKNLDAKLSTDIKNLENKIDYKFIAFENKIDDKFIDFENKMDGMFEKFTTVILEAVSSVSEKGVKESHENTLRIVEIERDRYSVLFEMNADHEAKIKLLDKRVAVLEYA